MSAPGSVRAGFLSSEVAEEFPELRLGWRSVSAGLRASPPAVRRRLAALADGYRGAGVVAMRTHPVPQAYRAFFRQIGLDPDRDRIPSEQVALRRLVEGGFRSVDLLADALLIALVETGVPVWALDSASVHGSLGIRTARQGELLAERPAEPARPLRAGWLVVADEREVCAMLFREVGVRHAVNRRTEAVTLFAVAVPGVPEIHLEEALWMAAEALGVGD